MAADRLGEILELEEGRVVQSGSHNELKEQEGFYKQLINGMEID